MGGRRPSVRLYTVLLRLYPAEFRKHFGQDMVELFADQLDAERRRRGIRDGTVDPEAGRAGRGWAALNWPLSFSWWRGSSSA